MNAVTKIKKNAFSSLVEVIVKFFKRTDSSATAIGKTNVVISNTAERREKSVGAKNSSYNLKTKEDPICGTVISSMSIPFKK